MARSAEKAVTALARFRKMKMEEGKFVEKRPFIASSCTNLRKCEKWRRQILGEISRKVSQIQNAGLPPFQVRDLNDEINKLIREKKHWEDQILVCGGPDYKKIGPKMLDHDGKEVPGNRGYKYFGAAKDLPGVRELLTNQGMIFVSSCFHSNHVSRRNGESPEDSSSNDERNRCRLPWIQR